jgi:hypothetical protein
MGAHTKRRDSEYEGEDTNLNVTWVSNQFSWLFYLLLIVGFRWALYYYVPTSIISWPMGWTLTSVLHGVVRLRCRTPIVLWEFAMRRREEGGREGGRERMSCLSSWRALTAL